MFCFHQIFISLRCVAELSCSFIQMHNSEISTQNGGSNIFFSAQKCSPNLAQKCSPVLSAPPPPPMPVPMMLPNPGNCLDEII